MKKNKLNLVLIILIVVFALQLLPTIPSFAIAQNVSKESLSKNSTTNPPISIEVRDYDETNSEFWIDVIVGSSSQPVTDLKSIAFELTYTNTANIDYDSYQIGSFLPGAQATVMPEDANGKVSAAVYILTGSGQSGFGVILSVKFKAGQGHAVDFDFPAAQAEASDGSSITLAPMGKSIITGPIDPGGQVIYRFQVDMSHEMQHVNPGDIIGIRGTNNPLSWSSTLQMSDENADNVYIIDIDFTGTPAGTLIEYKFVHHEPPLDNNTTVTWEDTPGPTGPYYNRETILTETSQVLPFVYWNNYQPTQTEWEVQNAGVSYRLQGVKAVSNMVAWACGREGNYGHILRTTDGGNNWTDVWVGTDTIKFQGIEAFDQNSAFVTAYTGGDANTAFIYKTTNGGNSWNKVYEIAGGWVNHVKMFDQQNGIALGDPYNGVWLVLKTTDGGNSWQQTVNPPASTEGAWSSVLAVFWLDNNKGFFGTNTPNYYYTVDGGENWNEDSVPFLNRAYSIAFNHSNYGVAFDYEGPLARSTNGGISWDEMQPPGDGIMRHMVFHEDGFWINQGTSIYKSIDNGLTWEVQASAESALRYISFVTDEEGMYGWVVGSNGVILKYSSPGADVSMKHENVLPEYYGLKQNYPNPFNPETTIEYDLTNVSEVVLAVYDINGREIRKLVHEQKDAGRHSVMWNARDNSGKAVSSGVYFYQIEVRVRDSESQSFFDVKKMILMK